MSGKRPKRQATKAGPAPTKVKRLKRTNVTTEAAEAAEAVIPPIPELVSTVTQAVLKTLTDIGVIPTSGSQTSVTVQPSLSSEQSNNTSPVTVASVIQSSLSTEQSNNTSPVTVAGVSTSPHPQPDQSRASLASGQKTATATEPQPGPSTAVGPQASNGTVYSALSQGGYNLGASTRTLSLGIDSKIKAKIWADQFIEFRTLLKEQTAKFETSDNATRMIFEEDENGIFKLQKSKTISMTTLDRWFEAFFIFVSIYTEKKPDAAPDLMKYGNTIRKLNKRAGLEAAMFYDRQFRLIKEDLGQGLSFGVTHFEIYHEALAMGLGKVSKALPFQAKRSKVQKTCFAFNSGSCFRKQCTYKHVCQKCGGQHTKIQCKQAAATVKGGTTGPGPTAGAKSGHPSKM